MLKTFHLVETSTPHPLVASALDAALFERCRIGRPAPVHFVPMPRWGGWCHPAEDTKDGEVHLADHLLDRQKNEGSMLDRLVQVYLHEHAHRLTPAHVHDPAFVAVDALLMIRAGDDRHGRPHLNSLDLYCLQDFDQVEFCSIGEALDWALTQANELAESDLSAEACAAEILQRFKAWKEWKARTPAREEEAEAAKRRTAAAIRALQTRAKELSRSRWKWLGVGIGVGTFVHFLPMHF